MQSSAMMRRSTKKAPQRLGDILQQILKRQKIPVHFEDQLLRRVWDQAVGPQISAQTSPQHVKRGTLHVTVATSVWMHQLQFLKDDIIEKFNRLSARDPITAIRFSLGELPPAVTKRTEQPAGERPSHPLSPRDQRIIRESLDVITDQELKEILERVMTREISRRRRLEKKPAR